MPARRLAFVLGPLVAVALFVAFGSLAWWAPFAWAFFLIAVIAALIWLQSGEQPSDGA